MEENLQPEKFTPCIVLYCTLYVQFKHKCFKQWHVL